MQSKKANDKTKIQWGKYMVYIVFVIVFILFSVFLGKKGFTSPNNLLNILRQTAMISIMAVAGTFVIACGQIDLTVGSVASLSAIFAAMVLRATDSILLAITVSVLFGIAAGAFNGFLVTQLNLPAFLATMGMMSVIRGTAGWVTNMASIPIQNNTFNAVFGIGVVGVIPVLVLWTVAFYIAGVIIFNKTPFGRHVLATGGNEVSAGYSGIKTNKIKMMVFMMSGAFAAFAGVLYAGRMQAGRHTFGEGDEMSVIAAVVLGGAAMSGGSGSVIGALIGSILMGMISNALILAGISTSQQTIVKGAIIVVAVAISNLAQKKKK